MTASRPNSRSSDIDCSGALEQALALYAMPDGARLLRERPLPVATLQLIRIAAGDSEALASAATASGEPPARVVEAVVFYIQQMFFHDGADSYRTLGVTPAAATAAIKEHYRWLMRWLHPDRNPGEREAAWSERVNRAWKSLSTDERRSQYDAVSAALMVSPPERVAEAAPKAFSFAPQSSAKQVVLSARATRLLPAIVFGALAVVAGIVLVTSYRARLVDQADVATAAATPPGDDNSAQKAAIRDRIAFEEHAAQMGAADDSDPMVSDSSPSARPATVAVASGTGEASASPDADAHTPSAASAAATLQHDFTAAYARGDLKRMLDLFTPDAVGDGGGVDSIAADYSNLFAGSTVRELDLDGLRWTIAGDRIVGSGPFVVRILDRGQPLARDVQGWIRIDAVSSDGRWKIQRIEQANAP